MRIKQTTVFLALASALAFGSAAHAATPTRGSAKAITNHPAAAPVSTNAASETTPVQTIARSAEMELAKATKESNDLRDQIAAQKVPLAQELTTLEDALLQRRRELDRLQRAADNSALELATLKAEQKARQEELSYVSNLLDEYARSVETKISVCELQAVASELTAAKQAAENPTLSADERFDRQVAFAQLTCERFAQSVGGMRFPGSAVGPGGVVEQGSFLVAGPFALFGATNGGLAGVVIPQSGSTKPLVRALEGPLQAGIEALVASGTGTLPVDPSRGGALKALTETFDIVHVFKQGGPIMWPLLAAAVLGVLTVLERVVFLAIEKARRDERALERFFVAVTAGEMDRAIEENKKSKYYVLKALTYALEHRDRSISNALLFSQSREMKRYRRGIPILDTVITLAPLLGLLGTVTGMMGSFSLIGGDLSAPGAITGGIAEALIATAFGLGTAIVSLIPFNILNTRMENARQELEAAAAQLELLVNRPSGPVQAIAAHHAHEPG